MQNAAGKKAPSWGVSLHFLCSKTANHDPNTRPEYSNCSFLEAEFPCNYYPALAIDFKYMSLMKCK
ncbi:hypothetical protein Taro_052892, partial [Colocasia esculenta]|nr:hypothetical protein [Colocasia esculenta]